MLPTSALQALLMLPLTFKRTQWWH